MAAYISMRGPYDQISTTFGRLYGWIGRKGYVPSAPPVGVYFNTPGEAPDEDLQWELRGPIAGDVPSSDPDEQGVGVKRLEALQVASAMHRGPFDQVRKTYQALVAWITENDYQIAGPCEEVYLSDASQVPPEQLLTEIRFPVAKG